jgi:hypothetical protein
MSAWTHVVQMERVIMNRSSIRGRRHRMKTYVAITALMATFSFVPVIFGSVQNAQASLVPHLLPPATGEVAFFESTSPLSIGLVDADGSDPRRITVPLAPGEQFTGSPQLSPNGTMIAFDVLDVDAPVLGLPGCGDQGPFLEIIDSDGSNEHGMAVPYLTCAASSPSWSPDSARLAFDAYTIPPGYGSSITTNIWTVNANGNGAVELGVGQYPTWSPSGSQIAFFNSDDGQIYSVSSSGGVPQRLTDFDTPFERAVEPLWSPNGSQIAVVIAVSAGAYYILDLMNGNGTDVHQVFSFDGGGASWAPDGEEMLLSNSNDPAQGFPIVDLDGQLESSLDVPGTSPQFAGVSQPAADALLPQSAFAGITSTASGGGYWKVSSNGGVFSYGDALFYGSLGGDRLNAPIVSITATSDGAGYRIAGADGGVFCFGDAGFYGSMGGHPLNRPVVGIAADPATGGYWEVAADGGVFSFNAPFLGSTGGMSLNAPIVAMASTPDGGGYWLVGSDGGVFSYGDARFYGSMGGMSLNRPIAGMAVNPSGGYWLVGSDGGIFSFGNATFIGSMATEPLAGPVVGISRDSATGGYRELTSTGGVFDFDAPLS